MEHIPSSNAQEFKSSTVTSREYLFEDASLNLAPITISGRYPENGYTSNSAVDSVVHIINGEGVIGLKNGDLTLLAPGDQIRIAVGDEYFFEGDLDVIYAATPPWTPEQTVLSE